MRYSISINVHPHDQRHHRNDNSITITGVADDTVTLDSNAWVQLEPTHYQSNDSTPDAIDVIL